MRLTALSLTALALLACRTSPPPTPSPTPTPPPSPSPTAVPPPSTHCPLSLPLPPTYRLILRLSKGGQQVGATPVLRGSPLPPPGWTGSCSEDHCDLSPEKDLQNGIACSVSLCGLYAVFVLSPPTAGFLNWQSGYTAKYTLSAPSATITATCQRSAATGSIEVP
jgi:hypothetical protein